MEINELLSNIKLSKWITLNLNKVFKKMIKAMGSDHHEVAEKAILLINNDNYIELIKLNDILLSDIIK